MNDETPAILVRARAASPAAISWKDGDHCLVALREFTTGWTIP